MICSSSLVYYWTTRSGKQERQSFLISVLYLQEKLSFRSVVYCAPTFCQSKYKEAAEKVFLNRANLSRSIDFYNFIFQTYVADIFFGQEWNDHRLRLPSNMTREYQLLPIEWLNRIWRPDSYFKNAKQVTFQTMTIPNHYVWLYRTKKIFYMVK